MYSARGAKGGGSPAAQQYIQGTMRLRQEQAARAAQLQQNAMAAGMVNAHGQIIPGGIIGYPQNQAQAQALMNARFKQGVPGAGIAGGGPLLGAAGAHLPDNMTEAEKRNQLARQAAGLPNNRRVPSGMMPANVNQQLQAHILKQQQQMYVQQQAQAQAQAQAQQQQQAAAAAAANVAQQQQHHQQLSAQQQQAAAAAVAARQQRLGGQRDSITEDAIRSHSPTPQASSPVKRQRLSPDGEFANRPMSADGQVNLQQQQQQQQQQQMMLMPGAGVTGPDGNAVFSAQMMQQLKVQQAQAAAQAQAQGQPLPQQFQQYNAMVGSQQRAMMNAAQAGKLNPNGGSSGPNSGAGGAGSPMQQHQDDNQQLMFQVDGYNNGAVGSGGPPGQQPPGGLNANGQPGGGAVPGTGPGNHPAGGNASALQDYQMQLMLLEQQNKKRLLVAKQEQQDGKPGEGQPGPQRTLSTSGATPQFQKQQQQAQGQNMAGMNRMGTSASPPAGNAGAPSSAPELARRNTTTPRLANQTVAPVSPLTDVARSSPNIANRPAVNNNNNSNGSNNGQANFNGNIPIDFNVMVGEINGPMMRPWAMPGGHPNMPQAQQSQQQQQQQQQPQQGPRGSISGPGQVSWQSGQQGNGAENNSTNSNSNNNNNPSQRMPPPQGIVNAVGNRTQPSSPNLINPPTPTQANATAKSIVKGKKEPVNNRKKVTGKKGTGGAGAPATPITSEPPTPTTPITPHNPPNAFGLGAGNASNAANNNGTNAAVVANGKAPAAGNKGSNNNSNDSSSGNNTSLLSMAANFSMGSQPGKSEGSADDPTSGVGGDYGDGEPSFFNEFTTGTEGELGDIDFDFESFLNTDG
ncbi:hypothetical protein AWJ20_1814 [Sugiyamaella lignohabitans]|uniref:Uncharacterized protein n=1 Tax=Sugiyamaella lignohabitans TaxID=796027 RepID=A0A167E0W8_9ASCO|nr:uncharacterized protein AWJ20_1814 [Sugiyamaella lignohabitans]ANB13519.1 hypothetical protein AWJ20_1814 [Sugiyamaella lignohabitans]